MFLKKVVRLGLQYRQVSHQNHEFSKRVATTSSNLSNWGGTQCMDRWWLSLKSFVPSSCNRRIPKKEASCTPTYKRMFSNGCGGSMYSRGKLRNRFWTCCPHSFDVSASEEKGVGRSRNELVFRDPPKSKKTR